MTKVGSDKLEELSHRDVLAYPDRFSACPGQTIKFMVSAAAPYDASIIRLTGVPRPQGRPWMTDAGWRSSVEDRYQGRRQDIECGSWALVDGALLGDSGFTMQIALYPTTPESGRQFLMGQWCEKTTTGAAVLINEHGCLTLLTGDGQQRTELATDRPLRARQWVLVTAVVDTSLGCVRLEETELGQYSTAGRWHEDSGVFKSAPAGTPFGLAAHAQRQPGGRATANRHFNGKLEAPVVLRRPLDEAAGTQRLADIPHPERRREIVAAWDFSLDMASDRIVDTGAYGHHGRLLNLPSRAVRGPNWSGREHCWVHATDQYAAIHFHDDDLYDAAWEPDFELRVPDDAESGIYAARLRTGDSTEYVPFFVTARRGQEAGGLLVLLPTASYLAYANERLALDVAETESLSGHVVVLHKEDLLLATRPELGLSLYDRHADGSGVFHSSRLRPIVGMKPGRLSAWIGSEPRAPWQFSADLALIEFLEHEGIPYNVATDEDLHHRGLAMLSKYRVVMTGSHPEYHSTRMMDALEAYLQSGGRLMYMGGNGFYWRIAFNEHYPGAIELRRAEDGIRDWTCEPGEYYHSFTGELGGLWRRIGRPPQGLVGVGMAAQGFDYSGRFQRTADAADPRVAFIFDGVEGEIIGDFGEVGGGAAGLELDRADAELGTPDHALILASSEGHTNLTFAVPEEVDNVSDQLVATRNPSLRGDIVFFETPEGGAVFSVGSIAWAGSLAHEGFRNNVARMTLNTLRRFLDPEPFEDPSKL